MRILLAILFPALAAAQAEVPLTLAEAEAAALKNHPSIAAASASLEALKAVKRQVRSVYEPQVIGNFTTAGAERNTAIAAGNVTTSSLANRVASGLNFTQLITDFGRTSRLVEAAGLRSSSQGQTLAFTRSQVLLQVRQAYYQALAARRVLQVAQDTVAARRLTLKQVSALADSKLRSTLDVSFAEVNVSEAELGLFRAENDLKAAMAQLTAAMGYADERPYRLQEEPMPEPLTGGPEPLIKEAIRTRTDLQAAHLTEQSARSSAQAERKLLWPSLSVIGSAGVLPTHEERLQGRYSGIGLNVAIPVFNGGLLSARGAEAIARAEVSGAEARALELRISRDVRVAWLNAENAQKRLDVTERLLGQAARALKLAQARYDIGLSSIVELTQAQLNHTSAEITRANAQYEYQIRYNMLAFEAGRLQ